MTASPYLPQAQALAARMTKAGRKHTLANAQLREIFGVSRVTAAQRQAIVGALEEAGIEVVSGATSEPMVVRKRADQSVAAPRPWFKRKRVWAIAGVLFFGFLVAVSPDPDAPDETASNQAGQAPTQTTSGEATVATETTPAETGPTRADLENMVDDDVYAEALAAAALLGEDDESYIARRIANRLARRTMFALAKGDRSRARFLVAKSEDYPSTSMSRDASGAYQAAQARASARTAARRVEAQRVAQEDAAREEAERAIESAPDIPDASVPDSPSGPSTTNWCGKRDGDGDGIYCE